MKPLKYRHFVSCSQTRAIGMMLVVVGFCTAPAFAVNTTGVTNTYNGSLAANGLGSGANWTVGSPFSSSGAGAYADLVFTGADSGSTFTASGGSNTFMNAESYNVTDGNSYALQISSSTAARFNVGATSNNGTSLVVLPFTNSVSGVAQDLIYLSNSSNLTFNATNSGGGSAVTLPLLQAGNFNVGTGSTLTVNAAITGTPALTINGSGTTIFSGANTYSGTTTVNGGTFEISGTHVGNGALTHNDGFTKISGSRSGTGATTVRNGMLEISGTNGGTSYSINGNVSPSEPVLKLSNVNALPVGAILSGSNSTALDGTVDLAVAGSYILGSYNAGNITFTTTSGSPTNLTFTDASKITAGANSSRTFNNGSQDLSVLFAGTLDIGGDGAANININGSGDTTIAGDILSTGAGVRGLTKNGSGTLTLNVEGTGFYTGTTNVNAGKLVINGNISTSSLTTVSGSGTISGSGTVGDLTVASGGTLSPGNSPGTLATGNEIWENGGNYNWQMLDATGAAGSGYDTIAVSGTLDLSSLTADGFGINLWSLSSIDPDVNGDALNFNEAMTQSWTILTTTGGIIGFDAADFAIATGINNNTGGFSNIHSGAFSLGQSGNLQNLILTYTAVPEPTVAVLGGIGLLGLLRRRRNG